VLPAEEPQIVTDDPRLIRPGSSSARATRAGPGRHRRWRCAETESQRGADSWL